MSARRTILVVMAVVIVATSCATNHAYPDGIACGNRSPVLLMAQAVPTTDAVPCLDELPAGFSHADTTIRDGHIRASLRSDRNGTAATLTFEETCQPGADSTIERSGGCLSWEFADAVPFEVREELQTLVVFITRADIQADVRDGFIEDAEL